MTAMSDAKDEPPLFEAPNTPALFYWWLRLVLGDDRSRERCRFTRRGDTWFDLAVESVQAAVTTAQPVPPRRQCSKCRDHIRSKEVGQAMIPVWPTPPYHMPS